MGNRGVLSGMILGILLSFVLFFDSSHTAIEQFKERRHVSLLSDSLQIATGAMEQNTKIQYIDSVLQQAYYEKDKVHKDVMQENALKGYVEAIGDPHTEYLTKKENEIFTEGMQGSQHFEGIGAVVSKKKDGVMISEVLKGSPAFNAGLKPLDIILQISGDSTQTMELSDAVSKIRGPKGTMVTLTIFRQSDDASEESKVFDITVQRGTIDVPSARASIQYTGSRAYLSLEVSIFGEDTIATLRKSLLQLSGSYDGVMLDLRGNGGGYLPTAVQLASFFLPANEIVTTAKYSILPEEIFRSEGYGDFIGKPVVVLVDGMSASASEIVAGALQQRGNAILVGEKTFGKGSIQTIQPLEDGSMLKYTIGRWYLPNGETIDHSGITPQYVVAFDRSSLLSGGVDTQKNAAEQLLIKAIQ